MPPSRLRRRAWYTYGPETKVGTFSEALMAQAQKLGWVVISLKKDFKKVFAWE